MAGYKIDFVDNSVQLAHYAFLAAIKDAVTATDQGWETLRYDTSGDNHELILKGNGLSGTEEIYVGFRTYQNVDADYYNLLAGVFTGYVDGNSFDTQPGAQLSGIPAINTRIDYWLTWNAQRIALAYKIETVYQSAYVGKILPYARPSQFPYPIVCAGMLSGAAATRYSDTSYVMPYKGNCANMRMRDTNGTWQQVYCYPFSNARLAGDTEALRDTEGNYHLMPVELYQPNINVFGALDGVFFISGFNNEVENLVTIGATDYIVFRNVWSTGFNDYYALRMGE